MFSPLHQMEAFTVVTSIRCSRSETMIIICKKSTQMTTMLLNLCQTFDIHIQKVCPLSSNFPILTNAVCINLDLKRDTMNVELNLFVGYFSDDFGSTFHI